MGDEHAPDALSLSESRFAPLAKRYRAARLRSRLIVWLAIALTVTGFFTVEYGGLWVALLGLVLLLRGRALGRAIPKLRCPGCKHHVERLQGFCPRCGVAAILPGRWRGYRCGSCSKGLGTDRKNRKRRFPIRYCSRCGDLLDRSGV